MTEPAMSDQSKQDYLAEEAVETSAEATADNAGGDYEVVVRLIKENEELKDRALRVAADMENLRRRTARDVHDARSYAIANFARDMLSVSDNLQRALDAVPEEAKVSGDAGFKALFEGVDITERAMISALERHGVKKLNPEGEKFDPNFHQAMFEVPNADVPANTVVQVVQAGYSIGDRMLRPAMVGIAKGGPKHAASGEPAHAADDAPAEPGPVNDEAERDA
jgi:molecular chaperone GrpE